MTPEAATNYVTHCLRLNPMWEADAVLIARAEVHGIESMEDAGRQQTLEQARQRANVRSQVFALRDNAWTTPPEETLRELAELPIEDQPELEPVVRRLTVVAKARPRLAELATHRHYNEAFFEGFKQVLTGGPQQAALVREQGLAVLQDRRARKHFRRMVKLLRRELPELCALEADWLNSVRRGRFQLTLYGQSRGGEG